jgi:hypothetical protein
LHEFRLLRERGPALCQPVVKVVDFRHALRQMTNDWLGCLVVDA